MFLWSTIMRSWTHTHQYITQHCDFHVFGLFSSSEISNSAGFCHDCSQKYFFKIRIKSNFERGIIFRPDFWILGHRDLAPYSPTCMRPCLTLPGSSWFRSEQWNVANSGRERREWKLGGSKSGRIPPLAVWERTVWSLHIGWGGLAFSHLGKQLPSLQSCTLVFNNTIAGTIARAALEGWELRHWHVGAFQAFPPAREYLPLYCHSHHCHRATLQTGTLKMQPWLFVPSFDRMRMTIVRFWRMPGRLISMEARWNMGSACSTCLKGVKVNSNYLW